MSSEQAARITKRLGQLKSARDPHVNVWRRCYDYTYPLRGNGFYGDVIDAQQGMEKRARLTDSTATESVRTLASGIMGGLTPANARWFEMGAGEESNDEERWLSDGADIIWKNIHAANFDSEAYEGVIDAVCAGWFVLYIEEAPEGGYAFELWPIAECFIASSKKSKPIDTVYRCYSYTVEQAVNEFGLSNVSESTRMAYQKEEFDKVVDFVHAIEPRKVYATNAKLAKNLPISSCHVEVTTKHVCRESGYHEMPCVVPRWQLLNDKTYAVGPVYDALPDIAMLNEVRAFELMNLDMAIAGMWIAEDDGVLNPRTVKVGPRKVITANSVESMKELKSSSNFQVAFIAEDRIQAQIRKMLLADQLQPQDGPAMTATEVHARINLIRQLLGPIYGRLQSEYLQPLIERCFGIAYRAGVLGVAPDSLLDREFHIKYISPLARAQKLEEVTAIDTYVGGLVALAQGTEDPTVMDNVDIDAASAYKGAALGVPQSIIPRPQDIQRKRQARAQAQQEAQDQQTQQAIQQSAGEAAVKAAVGQ